MRKLHKKLEEKKVAMKETASLNESIGDSSHIIALDETISLDFKMPAILDESRGTLVIEYFINHFVLLSKKCNEFRSSGRALMYLMQAENLLRLLRELKFFGSSKHNDLRDEIEQLKQHTTPLPLEP